MRVIAVIHETAVIRQILQHLKLWHPRPIECGPPKDDAPNRPVHAQLPLEYVPVPDIGRSCASLRVPAPAALVRPAHRLRGVSGHRWPRFTGLPAQDASSKVGLLGPDVRWQCGLMAVI